MTRLFGEDVARLGGDANEIASSANRQPGEGLTRDRNMDLLNNRTGRENSKTSTSKEDSIRKQWIPLIGATWSQTLITTPEQIPRPFHRI